VTDARPWSCGASLTVPSRQGATASSPAIIWVTGRNHALRELIASRVGGLGGESNPAARVWKSNASWFL